MTHSRIWLGAALAYGALTLWGCSSMSLGGSGSGGRGAGGAPSMDGAGGGGTLGTGGAGFLAGEGGTPGTGGAAGEGGRPAPEAQGQVDAPAPEVATPSPSLDPF